MKLNNKTILSIAIILVIISLFVYYIGKNLSDFQQLFSTAANPATLFFIILIAIIALSNIFSNGILINTLISAFGIKLKLRESFGLAVITRFYNTITPFRGGMVARAIYLKKRYKFPYVRFLATLSGVYLIIFLMASIAGLASMFFIWLNYGLFNQSIFFLFSAIFLSTSFIIIFSPKLSESKNRWLNHFVKVINGWYLIKGNKKVIFATIIISLIQLILSAINFMILYSIFNTELSFFKALFIASIASIAILVSITPGNLGVGDAINIFSAAIIGVELTKAVAAIVLGRAISLLIIFILGPIFSYILINQKNEKNK